MKRFKNLVSSIFCFLFFVYSFSQENKTLNIEQELKIESLETEKDAFIAKQKKLLKNEIKEVLKSQDTGEINFDEAQKQKEDISKKYAKVILDFSDDIDQKVIVIKQEGLADLENETSRNDASKKSEEKFISIRNISFGFNMLSDQDGFNYTDFNIGKSNFLGFEFTRQNLLNKSGSIRFNTGLAFNTYYYYLKDNKYFVNEGGDVSLDVYPEKIKKIKFNVNSIELPLHFEFGKINRARLSEINKAKKDKDFVDQFGLKSFNFGVGGFVGFNYYMMQKFKYSNNKKIKEIGNEYYNLEKFTYGLSSYVGYDNAKLFVKYNINPMFKNQDKPINNLSFGLSLGF